uniref:PCNA-interacting partner n=1 Tax=Cyprinus carpio carpio TaxID=630221 RepID=A0A8C1A140_CYPCA
MTRVFRRECHRVLDSERTTIQGADGMLMVLQLAMAGINKQVMFLKLEVKQSVKLTLFSKVISTLIKKYKTNVINVSVVQLFLQIQRVVRRVFCSYLGLLVKSKNDMALAFTLDNPNRSLGHIAFTDLSNINKLSFTVTSFVRAIQLGGKGYAPPESHPLRKHVKALSEFLNFIDQCQVLGETSNPRYRAGFKLVSSIRASLVKGRSNGDPVYLQQRIQAKVSRKESVKKRETVKVLMTLLDEEALAPPCRNKAELLPEDQAVLNGSSGACLLTLYKSPEAPTGSSPKPLRNRFLSQQEHIKSKVKNHQFTCTYKDEMPLNGVLEFPSTSQLPTCVHPAPKKPNSLHATNLRHEGPSQSALGEHSGNAWNRAGGKGTQPEQLRRATGTSKRKLANRECTEQGKEENQPLQKRPPTKTPTGGLGKRNKAPSKKLIAGQGKLTGFFRL